MSATAPPTGLDERRVRSPWPIANLDAVSQDDLANQERPPSPPPVSVSFGETRDDCPKPAAGREVSPPAGTVDAERAAPPPPNDVIELDSPENRDAVAFSEAKPSNADIVLPDMGTGSTKEERGPPGEETMVTGFDDARPDSGADGAPETDVNALASALATGSELPR